MTKEELKNKCTERAKIFQQAMESCKSSSPMDCIEWFADRIAELEQKLEKTEKDLADYQFNYPTIKKLEKENAELKGLKDVATLIRANNDTVVTLMQLNNKLVSKSQQLTNAKELFNMFLRLHYNPIVDEHTLFCKVEQFLKDLEK